MSCDFGKAYFYNTTSGCYENFPKGWDAVVVDQDLLIFEGTDHRIYWADESSLLNGPCETLETASFEQAHYFKNL